MIEMEANEWEISCVLVPMGDFFQAHYITGWVALLVTSKLALCVKLLVPHMYHNMIIWDVANWNREISQQLNKK